MGVVYKNPNCIHNKDGVWCTNKNIKRSLFGLGARCCPIYQNIGATCEFQDKEYRFPVVAPYTYLKINNYANTEIKT